jgi:hypothetical protein
VVEAQQLLFISLAGSVYIELAVDVKALNERVGHGHALWLHGVVLVIVELADLLVVEVGHIAPVYHLFIINQKGKSKIDTKIA